MDIEMSNKPSESSPRDVEMGNGAAKVQVARSNTADPSALTISTPATEEETSRKINLRGTPNPDEPIMRGANAVKTTKYTGVMDSQVTAGTVQTSC